MQQSESIDIFEAGNRGFKHKNLIFWVGIVRSLAAPIKQTDRILDYGCGHGGFLQFLYDFCPFAEGVGIDRDSESIDRAKSSLGERPDDWPIRYFHSNEFQTGSFAGTFDHIFSQEILWMNNDLHTLAVDMYTLLKPGGRCYCTFGSHADNPLWEYRRAKMAAGGMAANTWSVDQVAKEFSEAGFAVGLRRLPIEGFLMYHPETTTENSRSLYELVQTTSECKMLFYFGKHDPVQRADRLQG